MSIIQRSTYLRNQLAAGSGKSYLSIMTGSKLYAYNGPTPASPDAALGAVTLLFTISVDGGAGGLTFVAATPTNDGTVNNDTGETWKEDSVSNAGDLPVSFARLVDGSSNTLMQMPAVVAGDGLRMAELTPVDAAEQPLNSFQYTHPIGSYIQESLLLRQYLVATGSYRDAMALGKIEIYEGTVPASVEDAITTQTVLCTVTNNSTATGLTFASSASGGVLSKTVAETWSGLVSNAGADTASFFRYKNASNQVLMQGPIGLNGLVLEDTIPTDASTIVVRRFNYAIPE